MSGLIPRFKLSTQRKGELIELPKSHFQSNVSIKDSEDSQSRYRFYIIWIISKNVCLASRIPRLSACKCQ